MAGNSFAVCMVFKSLSFRHVLGGDIVPNLTQALEADLSNVFGAKLRSYAKLRSQIHFSKPFSPRSYVNSLQSQYQAQKAA